MTVANYMEILDKLDNGGGIQFCFYAGRYIIPAKRWKKWQAAGIPLIKRDDGGVWLRRGRRYDYAPDGTYTVYTYHQ